MVMAYGVVYYCGVPWCIAVGLAMVTVFAMVYYGAMVMLCHAHSERYPYLPQLATLRKAVTKSWLKLV